MAKSKDSKKADAVAVAAPKADKVKSKDLAKAAKKAAKEEPSKKKKKVVEPESSDDSEEESDSSESASSSDSESEVEKKPAKKSAVNGKAKAKAAASESESESDSDSDSESEEETAKPKVNGKAKAAAASDSESDSDSDSESDSDKEEAKPKVNGKAKADVAESSDSSDSSDSEEESDDKKAAAKVCSLTLFHSALSTKLTQNHQDSNSDDSEEDSDDSDDSEDDSDDSMKAEDASASKKRKADDEIDATPKKAKTDNQQAATTLFAGNLSWNIDDDALYEAFKEFEGLASARVVTDKMGGRSRGFGYVDFNDSDSATKAYEAMQGFELDGRALNLDYANARPAESTPQARAVDRAQRHGDSVSAESDTLFVGNLPFDTDQDTVRQFFGDVAEVVSVRLPTDP